MLNILKTVANRSICREFQCHSLIKYRNFLSHAYYCKEVWDQRTNDPLIKNVKIEELYQELDQRFQKNSQINAIDVDLFVNAVREETYIDEVLDLAHKLRLSTQTENTLPSTTHAVIRVLHEFNRLDLLLNVLDDRLNYGVFLDYYTGNLLMDEFWKKKDFTSGARVASQFMLQEEFEHKLTRNLAVLHCYNHLLKPGEWPKPTILPEPEEEVKVRVKFLRNPYFDDHFDLVEPNKIIGKTIYAATKNEIDDLSKTFQIVGLALYDKPEKAMKILQECIQTNKKLYSEVFDVLPDESDVKTEAIKTETQNVNVQELLQTNIKSIVSNISERDIAEQCENYVKWSDGRKKALEDQMKRLQTDERLAKIDDILTNMKEKESRLWFFENEENIELEIESKTEELSKTAAKAKTKIKEQDDYIPPEVGARRN